MAHWLSKSLDELLFTWADQQGKKMQPRPFTPTTHPSQPNYTPPCRACRLFHTVAEYFIDHCYWGIGGGGAAELFQTTDVEHQRRGQGSTGSLRRGRVNWDDDVRWTLVRCSIIEGLSQGQCAAERPELWVKISTLGGLMMLFGCNAPSNFLYFYNNLGPKDKKMFCLTFSANGTGSSSQLSTPISKHSPTSTPNSPGLNNKQKVVELLPSSRSHSHTVFQSQSIDLFLPSETSSPSFSLSLVTFTGTQTIGIKDQILT